MEPAAIAIALPHSNGNSLFQEDGDCVLSRLCDKNIQNGDVFLCVTGSYEHSSRAMKRSKPSSSRVVYGKLSGKVGIVCNAFLFLGKFLAETISDHVSIAADAVNNLSDAASSVVSRIGFKMTEKPADADHPYDHARYEYLPALTVAAMILIIGMELFQNSFDKTPHLIPLFLFLPAPSQLAMPPKTSALPLSIPPFPANPVVLPPFAAATAPCATFG